MSKSKNVAILVEEQYQVLEVWYPILRLKEDGIQSTTIGTGKDSYGSKEGYPVTADTSIENAKADDYDGLIIPGGFAPDFMRRVPQTIEFVKEMNAQGKPIAAICHGGWMLVSADCIRDKKVTCFYAIKDDLIAAGGNYVDEEVVVDGNIITSRKPDDLTAFTLALIKQIK